MRPALAATGKNGERAMRAPFARLCRFTEIEEGLVTITVLVT
jgi:hypothetical protein